MNHRYLAVISSAACCFALLSGCSSLSSQAHKLDVLLDQLDYSSAGQVVKQTGVNNIDSYSRHVEYDSAAPYAILLQRLSRLGYECTQFPEVTSATAQCKDASAEISVDLVRDQQESALSISTP